MPSVGTAQRQEPGRSGTFIDAALAALLVGGGTAQSRNQDFGRPDSDCGGGWNDSRASTHNGGIKLTLPERYSAELETGTVNGRVSIDFPVTVQGRLGRELHTTLGSGGVKIRAMTTNGGVTIHRR